MRHNKDAYTWLAQVFRQDWAIPLTSDLLMRLWNRIEDHPFKEALEHFISFYNPGFNCTKFSSFPNVEEFLSQMMPNEQLLDSSRSPAPRFLCV